MSDATHDTTSRITDWMKLRHSTDTPFYNYFQQCRVSFPMPPVIGHTPEKRVQRFIWSRVCRMGHVLRWAFGRFERHEGSGYDAPEEYWLKKDWAWLEAVGKRSTEAMPQPIYDPDWVRPAPRTVTWNWGTEPTYDPNILGVDSDGNEVRVS